MFFISFYYIQHIQITYFHYFTIIYPVWDSIIIIFLYIRLYIKIMTNVTP